MENQRGLIFISKLRFDHGMSIFFTNRVPSGWPRLYKVADRLGDRAGRLNHGQRPPCLDRPAIPPQESKNGIVPGTQEVSLWGGGCLLL